MRLVAEPSVQASVCPQTKTVNPDIVSLWPQLLVVASLSNPLNLVHFHTLDLVTFQIDSTMGGGEFPCLRLELHKV